MSERTANIERIIRSICHVYIRSKEGRTIDTDALDEIRVTGIELAAKEIAALAAADRVAGEDELVQAIRSCPALDENGYICEKQEAIKAVKAALALSPGKVSEEL